MNTYHNRLFDFAVGLIRGRREEVSEDRQPNEMEAEAERHRARESLLKNVLDAMPSGVEMIDGEGCIVLMNRQSEAFFGFSASKLLGKHYKDARHPLELTLMIKEGLERAEQIRDEIVFYYPEERTVEVNLVPLRSDGGAGGVVLVMHDMTALRRLERVRQEFVANVSHELKTPVAAVQGFAETLLSGTVRDEETSSGFLRIIYEESRRINRLIGDILELTKIESKQIPLQLSPVHLPAFARYVAEMIRPEADRKNLELKMDIPEELYLEADEDRLRQVVVNLLSNAVAYTPEGGIITVRALGVTKEDEEWVRLSVVDTGIGIPKKDIPHIFERFYRVDKARSRSSGGTGLGLSITRHLVELHGGTIDVRSQTGLGSEFQIELPMMQKSASANPPPARSTNVYTDFTF